MNKHLYFNQLNKLLDTNEEKFVLNNKELNDYSKIAFLASDINYSFKTVVSRNCLKIISISNNKIDDNKINMLLSKFKDKYSKNINSNILIFILNQFNKYDYKTIIDLSFFYYCFHKAFNIKESDYLFISLAINNKDSINKINNYCYNKLTNERINELIEIIKQDGYSYILNDNLYWKTFNPKLRINKKLVKAFFTNTLKNETENNDINKNTSSNIPTEVLTATNILLNHLGINFNNNDIYNKKIKTLILKTDELINEFDNMQDWEKLAKWKVFISEWNKISKEALDDRD